MSIDGHKSLVLETGGLRGFYGPKVPPSDHTTALDVGLGIDVGVIANDVIVRLSSWVGVSFQKSALELFM